MSDDDDRLLPDTEGARSFGWMAGLGIAAVACPAADLAVSLLLQWPFIGFTPYGVPLGLGALMVGVRWSAARRRVAEARRVAGQLGARFHHRVPARALRPLQQSSLFYLGDPRRHRADSMLEGEHHGQRYLLLTFAYSGPVRLADGRVRTYKAQQTVLILPGVGPLPRFHLSPRDHEWNEIMPGWPIRLGVGEVVWVAGDADDPSVLRGQDAERLGRLVNEECLDEMGSLAGWTLECSGELLLLYRHRERIDAERFPALVAKGVAIA